MSASCSRALAIGRAPVSWLGRRRGLAGCRARSTDPSAASIPTRRATSEPSSTGRSSPRPSGPSRTPTPTAAGSSGITTTATATRASGFTLRPMCTTAGGPVREQRGRVLEAAHSTHPERFVGGAPYLRSSRRRRGSTGQRRQPRRHSDYFVSQRLARTTTATSIATGPWVCTRRVKTLDVTHTANPCRFTGRPTPPALPTVAWLNKPQEAQVQNIRTNPVSLGLTASA